MVHINHFFGKRILCEKPVGNDLAKTAECEKTVQTAGVLPFVELESGNP